MQKVYFFDFDGTLTKSDTMFMFLRYCDQSRFAAKFLLHMPLFTLLKLKLANAEQFTTMAYESGSQADINFVLNAMQRYGRSRVNPNVPNANTDWFKEILRPGIIQSHSIGATGGAENASYSVGANYFAQEGILDMKNEYERFKLEKTLSKLIGREISFLPIKGVE